MYSAQFGGFTVLLDREDYVELEGVLAYSHTRITASGIPQLKLPCWRRWRNLDVALVGVECGRRNGDWLDLRRANLIPARRADLRRFSS